MSFPLTVGDRVVASPPELAALAQADADGPGGLVVPGQRPVQWILGLVQSGALDAKLAMGLGAALLQNASPVTVAEGARIAVALHPSPLDRLVVLALDAHDATVLLQVDPARPTYSVEDSLLRSAVAVAPLHERFVFDKVLTRVRNAGLPGLELAVLMAHGQLEDLQQWLPALLEEGLDAEDMPHIRERIARGDEGGQWLGAQGLID